MKNDGINFVGFSVEDQKRDDTQCSSRCNNHCYVRRFVLKPNPKLVLAPYLSHSPPPRASRIRS